MPISVETAANIFGQLIPEPESSLLSGIVFGAKTAIDIDLKDLFISTGTIHIMALSGMNITIIENLVARTLLRCISRKVTCVLTLLIIMGFVFFVGLSPSVVRAATMGSLALVSTIFGRQKSSLWLLTITSYGMVFLHPDYLTDIGFLLSVGATLGIILFSKRFASKQRWEERLPHPLASLVRGVKDELSVTLAAQVCTVPILFVTFHQLSLVAPLTNLLIGWTIVPITILGMLIFLLGLVYVPIASVLSWFCFLLLRYVVTVVTITSALPYASIRW